LGGLTTSFGIHWIPAIFWDGMFSAGIVWAINGIIEFFEENRLK
jgi:ABC-type Co2+ transport system permease subunit